MKRTIGVTGGNGFIGRWTVQRLLRDGNRVIIFDHKDRRPAPHEHEDVSVMLGDCRDEVAMMELAAHTDGIIHLAAVLGTQETIDDPRPAARTNLEGGLNFLHAINTHDLPGVYICVGNHWMNNPYSISKTTVERFCHMYRDEHGTKVNSVRAVNAYGPGQSAPRPYGSAKVRKITPSFVCRALSGDPIEVYGDGEQVSDMVWVGDVADTLVDALDIEPVKGVLECGPEEHATVQEIATLVARLVGEKLDRYPVPIVNLPMRPGEIPGARVVADPSTLTAAGLAVPSKPLVEGMKETVDYFASKLIF